MSVLIFAYTDARKDNREKKKKMPRINYKLKLKMRKKMGKRENMIDTREQRQVI
jgi:hypothetical protein